MKLLKRPAFYVTVFLIAGLSMLLLTWKKIFREAVVPDVQHVTVSRLAIVDDSVYIDLLMEVRNKGATSFELKKVDVTIMNDTVVLTNYVNDEHYTIAKNEVKEFPIEFVLPFHRTIAQLRRLEDFDSTFLRISGSVDILTDIGEKRFPVEQSISVAVPVPPEIRIAEVEYLGRSDAGDGLFDFRIKGKVVNKNDKELWLKDVTYEFSAEDRKLESKGVVAENLRIPPEDSVQLSIPFRLKVNNELELALRVLFDKDIIGYNFMMKGTLASVAGIRQGIPASYSSHGKLELYQPGRKKIRFVLNKKKTRPK